MVLSLDFLKLSMSRPSAPNVTPDDAPPGTKSNNPSSSSPLTISSLPTTTTTNTSTTISSTVRPSVSRQLTLVPVAASKSSTTSASSQASHLKHQKSSSCGNVTTAATTSVSHETALPQKADNMVENVNPNSATDYLRMAMGQSTNLRPEDDEKSGERTPRPDFNDKRIPGILHGLQQELTKSLTAIKDTPPTTPRGTTSTGTPDPFLSTEQGESSTSTAASSTSEGTRDVPSETGHSNPQLSVPKGRLHLRIIEARNLRTNSNSPNGPKDPYVVCTFESNQFISKGPQKGDESKKGLGIPKGSRGNISIAMKSRTNSSTNLAEAGKEGFTSPTWDHEALFDVINEHSEITVTVYDRANQESFLGMVRVSPTLKQEGKVADDWFALQPRSDQETTPVSGDIKLQIIYEKTSKKHYGPTDFQVLRLIGKGTFGQVYQVRKYDTNRIYAMKVLSKKVIVQKKEVAHTIGERNILVRTATTDSPFIVGLKFSFQTPTDLYLVTDYMSGGELFWHLQKEGRFSETRAKFYIAELILALEHLHNHDIVYRDLKPENILLDANGHIALCDFGLSKSNLASNATTNTFCGTTEYLAPEVLLDEQGYTKMVDFWSLGVLVFEMCCGWSPFYAEDTQQMYKNIAFGKVRFPKDALSLEGRNFVKGLLNRNPKHRLGANRDAIELKEHAFFADIDWQALISKKSIPPFKPTLKSETDTSNFDEEFTNAPISGSLNARAAAAAAGDVTASTPLSPTMQANFHGFTFVDESSMDDHFRGRRNSDAMDEDKSDLENAFDGRRSGGRKDSVDDSAHHDDDDDDFPLSRRMSGVTKSSGDDDSYFQSQNFDM